MFPGFDSVYSIEEERTGCFYADLPESTPQIELLRGEWKPNTVLNAYWSMGKATPSDFALGRTVSWYYLSSRLLRLFRDNQLTGWTTYPIALHDKNGNVSPDFAGLSITGRCGPIDEQRGALATGEDASRAFPKHVGLYFDESTWDGSDLFCPAGTNAYKFVTEKVVRVFETHDIRGVDFVPLSQATWYP